jgi:hypothetical protein
LAFPQQGEFRLIENGRLLAGPWSEIASDSPCEAVYECVWLDTGGVIRRTEAEFSE